MADNSKIEWTDATGCFDATLYQRSRVKWTQSVWYGGQRDLFAEKAAHRRGRQFEELAVKSIFERVALENPTDLARLGRGAPFDFIAFLNERRVAVDVSTKWQKRVESKGPIAQALGLPLYFLLISPRAPRFFYFTPVSYTAKSVRVPFSLLRSMAQELGDHGHGRRH